MWEEEEEEGRGRGERKRGEEEGKTEKEEEVVLGAQQQLVLQIPTTLYRYDRNARLYPTCLCTSFVHTSHKPDVIQKAL